MTGIDFLDESSALDRDPDRLIRDQRSSELYLRKKVPVGILGATGGVGQKFIDLLARHPWMEITCVAASEKSQGMTYKEAVSWRELGPLPDHVAKMKVLPCTPDLPCKIVFSALDSSVAGDIEKAFAEKGYVVISCAKNHRMDENVPLIIPEVNMDHLELIKKQGFPNGGMIVTKPNCAAIGLCLALRPIMLEFGLDAVHVVTMQSISGAGFPGVSSMSVLDNVIPYIADEEDRIERESIKVLGSLQQGKIAFSDMKISAQCTRVPVNEGHLEAVSIKLKNSCKPEDIIRAWREFSPPCINLDLFSSPTPILTYFEEVDYPQPKLHKNLQKGMGVAIGRLKKDPVLDYKFFVLSNNVVRGAAGGAILTAELLIKQGLVFW